MLKQGIKKELMFFSRSFRMWGVIIAAVLFAVVGPLIIKLSVVMLDSMSGIMEDIDTNNTIAETSVEFDISAGGEALYQEEYMGSVASVVSIGDLTSTLMLIFMLVIMYAAGGELKKRSMIIPQNAGLTPRLYILPKFIVYPISAALFAFCGMWIGCGIAKLVFPAAEINFVGILEAAAAAAVFDAFMITVYLTIGLCTAKAGIAVVIMYGGNVILSTLFTALGADKFHPFTLTLQGQNAVIDSENFDPLNFWGSIGITVLIMVLCYFVTLFVRSARKIDNRGKEEMEL